MAVETQQLDNLTRRLFRDPRLQESRVDPVNKPMDELDQSVSSSIELIERASAAVYRVQEEIAAHEETIYKLNGEVGHLSAQKEEALHRLVKAEQIIRSESERAAKAEAQASALDQRIKALEQRNQNLVTQLERMIQAVSRSFEGPAAADHGIGTERSLRVIG